MNTHTEPRLDGLQLTRIWLPVILILVPVVLFALYIFYFGVEVPYWDEWALVPLLDKMESPGERLQFQDLWVQHNEHRIFFPKLLLLSLARVSNWSVVLEMYAGFLLLVLTALGVWFIYRTREHSSLWSLVPIVFLMFSLGQWENILWGWQVTMWLQMAGVVWALYFLSLASLRGTLLAILPAIIASFSFNSGLIIWPVGALMLAVRRADKRYLGFWIVAGITTVIAYYANYAPPAHQYSLTTVLAKPLKTLEQFLINIGSPLSAGSDNVAFAIGMCLLGLLAALLLQKRQALLGPGGQLAPAAAGAGGLVMASFLSSLAAAAARVTLADQMQIITSRYVTLATIGVVGIYLLLLEYAVPRAAENRGGKGSTLFGMMIALLVVGIVSTNMHGLDMGKVVHAQRLQARNVVATIQVQSDEALERLYAFPAAVRIGAGILQEHSLSVFDPTPWRLHAGGSSATNQPLPDAAFQARILPERLHVVGQPGDLTVLPVEVQNVSPVVWPSIGEDDTTYQVRLGNHWLDREGNMIAENDGRVELAADLKPGATAVLYLPITIPREPGKYYLELDMVQEAVTWFKQKGSRPAILPVEVR